MLRQFRLAWGFLLVICVVLAIGSIGTVTAQSDNDDNVIYGAYQKVNGMLRIISDPSEARPSETVISWNKTGPQGPEGPPGPEGPSGASLWVNGDGKATTDAKVGIGTDSPSYALDVDGDIDVTGSIKWPNTLKEDSRLRTIAAHTDTATAGTILETNSIRFETTGARGQLKVIPVNPSVNGIYVSFASSLSSTPDKRAINKNSSYTYSLSDNEIGWLCWRTKYGHMAHGMYFIHYYYPNYIMIYCVGEYDQSP